MTSFSTIGTATRGSFTLQNGVSAIEFAGSEHADGHTLFIDITSPSSLVGGSFVLQGTNPNTGTAVAIPQTIGLIATGGGTPSAVNGNTAAATVIAGAQVANTAGILTITNTATIVIISHTRGLRLRMLPAATSGTATVTYCYVPARTVS
jgi:hypothetical protein